MAVKRSTIIKVFLRHAWNYPWHMLAIYLCTIIAVGSEAVSTWYFKDLVDALTKFQPGGVDLKPIWMIIIIMFVISLIRWISWRTVGFTTTFWQSKVMSDLQQTSFNYLIGHSYKFFSDHFTGSLVRKISRMSRAFENLADEFQFAFLPTVVIFIGALIGLSLRFPLLALAFFGWFVGLIIFNYYMSIWKLKIDIQRAAVDSQVTGLIADTLTNNLNVKLFNGKQREQGALQTILNTFKSLQIKGWNRGELIFAIQHFVMIVVDLFLMIWGVVLWSKSILTVGDLVLINAYLGAVSSRLWNIGRSFRNVFESFADAREMVEILEEPYEIQDKPRARKLTIDKGRVDFQNVSFFYHSTRPVLKNFNLEILPGEKIAFVGASGAGKTTITRLLFRFHDVSAGTITIDDQNIADVTQESLRAHISLVPQEPILFHRTLMDNIRYGRISARDEEVMAAAKKARCHEFIKNLPDGYQTLVGERGIKLSGGERQRVAIARAILKDAPILVLDEATSSLDSESEHMIQEALSQLMKNKTTIVVAHRLSTIMKMDRIVVLDEGKIVDSGTHQQLLRKKGTYQTLWQIQAGGFMQ